MLRDTRPPSERRFVDDRSRMFDLDRTRRLGELFHVTNADRDDPWFEAFYEAAWYASITIPEQAHFDGPDGFPYFRLDLPRAGEPFDSQSLGNIARSCVERHAGAALFASPDDPVSAPQVVLSMGRLDSLLRYDTAAGDPIDRQESTQPHNPATFDVDAAGLQHQALTVKAGHEVLTGTPSADFLPPYAARGLHRYMSHVWGIEDPRVQLLVDRDLRPSRNLVIGRTRSDFATEEEIEGEMLRLSWFLPPFRAFVLTPEDWDIASMTRLADLAG